VLNPKTRRHPTTTRAQDERGVSRDEMAAALLDVAEGRVPRDRLALKCLLEEMQVCCVLCVCVCVCAVCCVLCAVCCVCVLCVCVLYACCACVCGAATAAAARSLLPAAARHTPHTAVAAVAVGGAQAWPFLDAEDAAAAADALSSNSNGGGGSSSGRKEPPQDLIEDDGVCACVCVCVCVCVYVCVCSCL
jgi:hypothetical protein